ncbi:uncharacterized protein [Oscarella lobularis]|uniref:uncharacterized protein n=1 Tax=Oscarella lobularis TaxID=121494 RepID=UPI003313E1E1
MMKKRSGGDKTAYCLQAESSERQSHLSPTQIRELSCPLSLEMLAIFSGGRSKDTGIIDAECTSLSQLPSSNQSLFAVTNVTQLRVICDETEITKKISGPSEAMETLVLVSSLTTPCDCIKRAAAAWSLGAILSSEYAYKCGADGHEDVVAASGTNVTTKLCITNDRLPCVFGIWRVEVRWTSDDNIDLALQLPADGLERSGFCDNLNGMSPRTCSGIISSITNGRWVVTVGPDDISGSDSEGGFESATSKPVRLPLKMGRHQNPDSPFTLCPSLGPLSTSTSL